MALRVVFAGTPEFAAIHLQALINSGHRLTGANLGNGQYPNTYQGWGEPKLTDYGRGGSNVVSAAMPRAAPSTLVRPTAPSPRPSRPNISSHIEQATSCS